MNLSLADVLFIGLIIVIIAGLLAGLGELRDWLDGGRQLDRVQRLAALDNARRTPVSREDHGDPRHWPGAPGQAPLGDLVRPIDPALAAGVEYLLLRDGFGTRRDDIDPDPGLGCKFCGPPFDATAECGCVTPCGDPNCGALAWQAISNTEEFER